MVGISHWETLESKLQFIKLNRRLGGCSLSNRMKKAMQSAYVLAVENLSSSTKGADVRSEMEYYGPVLRCETYRDLRSAMVEFDRYFLMPYRATRSS